MNAIDIDGDSALIYAVYCGHANCARTLLDKGADVNRFGANTPLMIAASNGFYKCLNILLQHRLDTINEQNKEGNTALMLACGNGHSRCLQLLIQAGGDVNKADNNGDTAWTYASKHGHDKCLDLLFRAGIEIIIE